MLRLHDKWIWDFWLAEFNNEFHIFYLQAPKSLKDERRRHHNANIGHAVSTDLSHWDILPDALNPSVNESWDDLATWTGSIIKKEDLWYLFYTGVSKKEKGLIQRIGVALSDDLVHWKKYKSNPILEADDKWYEMLDLNAWHDHAWRDPYVTFLDDSYYAFITSRMNKGPADERGVIALAKSADLLNWTVLPPISESGHFGQLEIPQYVKIEEKHIILFSTAIETTSNKRKTFMPAENIKTGIYYLASESPLDNYKIAQNYVKADDAGSLYSGKLVWKNEELFLLSFHNYDENGKFLGYIADPIPIDPTLFR